MAEVEQHDKHSIIRRMNHWPPERISVPKQDYSKMPQYRTDCMRGAVHPLGIEEYDFHLVTVERIEYDVGMFAMKHGYAGDTKEELGDFIESFTRVPHIEWAIDNSFDGLYVLTQNNPASFRTELVFGVYLYAELATFWNLKYGFK